MAFFLSLAAAVLYGAGDFVGGVASRRASPLRVAVASQWVGLFLLVPILWIANDRLIGASLAWGAAAGISTGVGLVFLFRALSAEKMAIGAALAGVFTAVLPLVFGLVAGERPSPTATAGLILAVASIAVIVYEPDPSVASAERASPVRSRLGVFGRPGVLDGIIAGFGWGGTSIFLAQSPIDGGLWPLASAQTVAVVVLTVAVLAGEHRVVPPRAALLPAAGVGALHVFGVISYLAALQRGLLVLVAVVQSLYPAATILLARLVLKERLSRRQIAGLVAAGAGVTLIGLG